MPVNYYFLLALAKLFIIFFIMMALLRLKFKLWQAILAGCAIVSGMALYAGALPGDILRAPLSPLRDESFLLIEAMIFGLMVLSDLQADTGQSKRLVEAVNRYLIWPRLRLMLFPALVGFFPMPGGALFSCPMLDAAAHGLDIPAEGKALINYWFRHIWETAWPLYPGFILACSLVGIPFHALIIHTFPIIIISVIIGWFFFIRDIKIPEKNSGLYAPQRQDHSPGEIFYESLPILITILGAAAFSIIIGKLAPGRSSQIAFVCSLALANLAAWLQGRGQMKSALRELLFNRRVFSLLLMIYTIFIFKELIGVSGIVAEMSHAGGGLIAILVIFTLLPMACGVLTGIMVGYVGTSFPILLGVIAERNLDAYSLPLVVLAIVCGQTGQLVTPLHVCVAVTCEYYHVNFSDIWRDLLHPLALFLGGGIILAGALFAANAHF